VYLFSEKEEKYCELDSNKIMNYNTGGSRKSVRGCLFIGGAATIVKKRLSKQHNPFFFLISTKRKIKKIPRRRRSPVRRTAGSATDGTSSNRKPERFSRIDSCAKNPVFKTIFE